MDVKNIIRRIATENGVTPEEVEKEMMDAIRKECRLTVPSQH